MASGTQTKKRKFGYLLREWLDDRCLVCKQKLSGHEYAHLSVVVVPSDAAASLVEAFRQHRWSDIRTKEFVLTLDALGGNVLRCPSGRLAWFITFEPYGLDSPYYVAESEVLNSEESRNLGATIHPEEWRTFPSGFLFNDRILAKKLNRARKRLLKRFQSWLGR